MCMDSTDQFKLPVGRVIWQDLFTPRSFTDEKTGKVTTKYSVSVAWHKDQMAEVNAIIDQAIGRLMQQPNFPKYACLKGGAKEKRLLESGVPADQIENFSRKLVYEHDLEKAPHLADMVMLKANANENSIPVIRGPGGKDDRITSDRKEEIYRGCYGVLLVSLGYHKAQKQLFYVLKGFQKARDGEPLMSNSANINLFDSFNSEASNEFGNSEEI